MADLLINFDLGTQSLHSSSSQIKHKVSSKAGSWTQKLKEKRKEKHFAKKKLQISKTLPSSAHPQSPQNLTSEKNSSDQISNPISSQKQLEARSEDVPRKKPKVETKTDLPKQSGKLQVISSLFSSTIIPTIKPSTTQNDQNLTVYAPSNASLSDVEINSFSLNLHPQISHHLSSSTKIGPIRSPTGIQSIAWPLLTSQSNDFTRDVIIQSQTGSGKTLAYLVPIIQDLLRLPSDQPAKNWSRDIGTLAIVLVPTRELAEQVYNVAINLLAFSRRAISTSNDQEDLKVHQGNSPFKKPRSRSTDELNPRWLVPGTLHGGTNRSHEKARLRRGLPILVCTPGRLLDHLEKTSGLRLAGEPLASTDDTSGKQRRSDLPEALGLRWLVVDEADRLMDMGFEEQMCGILKHLVEREARTINDMGEPFSCRRTILCSATMPEGVKKLAGLTLKDPIILKAGSSDKDQVKVKASLDEKISEQSKTAFSAPSQLSQHFVITPPKLRLVSLLALLSRITHQKQKKPAGKVLVFMSCTASVDFHFEAIGGMSMGRTATALMQEHDGTGAVKNESDAIFKHSEILPGVKLFRLHGNLDLQTRLASLNAFSKPNNNKEISFSSVLLCTSLAGRGLDVPYVSHVIQYDLPTEGGVTEYLHRVGRTARAGQCGEAWSFLLPSEEAWLRFYEKNQRDNSECVRLREVGVQELLQNGFGGKVQKEWETRATDAQMAIERWVIKDEVNSKLASSAFSSHIRAYATHPSDEKIYFHVKNLHLGHLAKSFALREAPKQLSNPNNSTSLAQKSKDKRHLNTEQAAKSKTHVKRKQNDESEDEGYNIKQEKFEVLHQFKRNPSKSLKGPMGNGIDEFNIG
ncbi:hypothetical protein O181_018404 [Austropuccinia psidii MF-1]|uniref:ATP-dependent RNA helicase n=1 Tax=Austropuccinia psidii MF-1 TaxID=1389203 RepID=A0A9Q3GTR2_9BASI|nr:hypothetical protein [Austropuccinia psidii MF-1]